MEGAGLEYCRKDNDPIGVRETPIEDDEDDDDDDEDEDEDGGEGEGEGEGEDVERR